MRDSLTREVKGIIEMAISRNIQRYKHTLAAFVDRMAACTDARIVAEQRYAVFRSFREINRWVNHVFWSVNKIIHSPVISIGLFPQNMEHIKDSLSHMGLV